MIKTSDLVHSNIENLTSMWCTVGERVGAHTSCEVYDYGFVEYSEWPNRLWFHRDIDEESLNAAKEQMSSSSAKLVIPYWDIYQSDSYKLLEDNGFQKLFEQVGMSLQLAKRYEQPTKISMEEASNEEMALLWEGLFRQAFGYKISHKLLLPGYENLTFLIAYHQNEPVGTAILHKTGEVAGIHAMGVIPKMRRRGFAEQMMVKILNQCIEEGFSYSTLQASAMGKGLYVKLGFEEQFAMKNYALVTP